MALAFSLGHELPPGVLGQGPGRGALVGSIVLHVMVLGAALWAGSLAPPPPPAAFKVYRVNIVSPPPQALGMATQLAPPQPAASQTAKPTPAKPTPKIEKPPPPTPAPKAHEVRATKAPPKRTEKSSHAKAATITKGAHPDASAREHGAGLNVRMEGEDFPYPDYLQNIIFQISRYFRWNGASGLMAEVYFVIKADGSVKDIRVLNSSGNYAFDLQAQGAVEAAGNRKEFGPLPKGFHGSTLPISFSFKPPR